MGFKSYFKDDPLQEEEKGKKLQLRRAKNLHYLWTIGHLCI